MPNCKEHEACDLICTCKAGYYCENSYHEWNWQHVRRVWRMMARDYPPIAHILEARGRIIEVRTKLSSQNVREQVDELIAFYDQQITDYLKGMFISRGGDRDMPDDPEAYYNERAERMP